MRYLKRLGLAAVVIATTVAPTPAFAATVIPISGLVHSYVTARGNTPSEFAGDQDQDTWSTMPADLTTTSAVSYFPITDGLIASSQSIGATWATSGLSGTMSIVDQALANVPDGLIYTAFNGGGENNLWSYRFHASTDALFTFVLNINETTSGNVGASRFFDDGLYVNGVHIPWAFDGPDNTTTYALLAGEDYIVSFQYHNEFRIFGGTAVVNHSDIASWTISDMPSQPGGGGTGGAVPEPATWAQMLFGFGLMGGILRGRRRSNVIGTNISFPKYAAEAARTLSTQ